MNGTEIRAFPEPLGFTILSTKATLASLVQLVTPTLVITLKANISSQLPSLFFISCLGQESAHFLCKRARMLYLSSKPHSWICKNTNIIKFKYCRTETNYNRPCLL